LIRQDSQDDNLPHIFPADPARRSDAISIARVICILGVIYVHAWTGRNGVELEALRGSPQDIFRWVLMEALGRSAVPLLGLISGWLVAGSSRTRNWTSHVGRKARTIALPMILWNAIAIVIVSGAALYFSLQAPMPQSWEWVAQELFILTRNPDVNVQMPFLRDLFLCMLAAPLLVRLPTPLLLVLGAAAGACHIVGLGPPVLMRASILFFFLLGIVARRTDAADRVAALPFWIAAVPYALLMPLRLVIAIHLGREPGPDLVASVDLVARIAAALFFWRLSWHLASRPLGGVLLRIEPYAFFLFCAHLIFIWLAGPLVGKLTGPLGAPLYPFYLLFQPLLILVPVIAFAMLLRRTMPPVATLLSGGRLARG
jgi:hypothetical protein